MFVRDGRTLPYVPATLAALAAIREATPARRLAYARSLYLALLELANEARGDRAAMSRKALGERAGCSKDLISDLAPMLVQAGVVVIEERFHGGERLENEWQIVEPETLAPRGSQPLPPVAEGHGGGGSQPRRSKEEEDQPPKGNARERASAKAQQLPDDFPDALREHARRVYRVLRDVAEQHNAREVTPRGVGLAIMGHPGRRFIGVAYELASWAQAPPRPVKDVVGTYRTFLDGAPTYAGVEPLEGPRPVAIAASAPRRGGGTPWTPQEMLALGRTGAA